MLPWNFEAFRRFLAFDVLQQACASLLPYEDQHLFTDESLMLEFTERLYKRTGQEWMPKRTASEGVLFNIEGSVFRNKARVFSSLYLITPECLETKEKLKITEFGKALGLGYVSETQFYELILTRFEYPHPAYEENWSTWIKSKKSLKPFLYVISILIEIHNLDDIGSVSASELAEFAFEVNDNSKAKEIAKKIVESRDKKTKSSRERSDQVDRKINDILGFMCISGVCYYDSNNVSLNLLDRHADEKAFFWEKRNGQDRKQYLQQLVKNNLEK